MTKLGDLTVLKTSDSDPDPHGSALKLTPWIRIRIRDADSGSSSYKVAKKIKNIEYFCSSSLTYFADNFTSLNFVSFL